MTTNTDTDLIQTRYQIILPEHKSLALVEVQTVDLARQPGLDALEKIVEPIIGKGQWMEHVSVAMDIPKRRGAKDWIATDMFVDENGFMRGLPYNEVATLVYHNAAMRGITRAVNNNPIVGPAVLFHRRVWF